MELCTQRNNVAKPYRINTWYKARQSSYCEISPLVPSTHHVLPWWLTALSGNTGPWSSLGEVDTHLLHTTLLAACSTPATGDHDHLTENDATQTSGSTGSVTWAKWTALLPAHDSRDICCSVGWTDRHRRDYSLRDGNWTIATWLQICVVCLICRLDDVWDRHSLTSSMSASRSVQLLETELSLWLGARLWNSLPHDIVEEWHTVTVPSWTQKHFYLDSHITLFCFSF